ncbi:MAG: DUF3343 domain-containing protein [Enterocloster asparagiformis]|nr:DUF3343 domain-containing protein [Enterocloster asparagiformis]
MRKAELKLVITFHTTAEAMALERACRDEQIPGRLIPVPRQISADCGLSWSMPVDWRERVLTVIGCAGLRYESLGEYVI